MYGWVGEPPVRIEHVDRVELAARGRHGTLEVRRLGIEHTVQVAAQRTRHLASLELEERPGRADPAQERADRLAALPGRDPAAPSQPPRCRQPDLAEARGERRCLLGIDDELQVRPAAGEAQRATGEEPATQPRGPAMLGGSRPFERGGLAPLPRPSKSHRQPRDRRFARAEVRAEPGRLRDSIARPRRVDRGELVAQGRDEIPFRAGHATIRIMPCGRPRDGGPSIRPRGHG